MRYLLRLLLAAMVAMLLPHAAFAQTTEWRELRTRSFAILYAAGDEDTAQTYAGFADAIYDETSAIFGHQVATPISLRLYPTWDSYVAVNPLAAGLQGIVAHADYQRHEVVVVVSQTARQSETEVQNNVRHELTHIVASDLSGNRLNVLFQEGVAQYVEHAAPELETRVSLLRRATANDALMRWSDLDDRQMFYDHSEVSYPQSLSITAFLIEKYTFATFRSFLTTSASSTGYRSALERTYGIPADQLEKAWRDWLPEYLAGGYRRNAISAYDLSHAQQLLGEARYTEAADELTQALAWLRTTDQSAVAGQAESLLERAKQGQQALALASDARAKLEAGDYAGAALATQQAQQAYAGLGDTMQDAVLGEYAARASRGQAAQSALAQAGALADGLRYPEARAAADRAAAEFAALGNSASAQQALLMRATLDQYQSWLGLGLLVLGALGVMASIWRRLAVVEADAW